MLAKNRFTTITRFFAILTPFFTNIRRIGEFIGLKKTFLVKTVLFSIFYVDLMPAKGLTANF